MAKIKNNPQTAAGLEMDGSHLFMYFKKIIKIALY